MPSFAMLFRDQRGDDLVAYLESLRGAGAEQHIAAEKLWRPAAADLHEASADEGKGLYNRYCATCHDTDGRTRLTWRSSFEHLPTNLATGPFFDLPASATREELLIFVEEIAKFGVPGTDMPGHEYLPDKDIASISLCVLQNMTQPVQNQ